jgi:methyltransferase-like protein
MLEIGCGDGANLYPLADAWPEATFYGFDLAASAVAVGQHAVAELGLPNIRLEVGDISQVDPGDLGTFDYVVAHGMYSWVPAPVREAMMALIRGVLAPHGVAFVSYATLPGCRLRQVIRDAVLFHLGDHGSAKRRMEDAHGYLSKLAYSVSAAEPQTAALKAECAKAVRRPPEVLFHDELSPFYHPVHLHEFNAHAERHGLRFLAQESPQELYRPLYPGPDDEHAHALSHGDLVRFQQYEDVREMRMFRRTLVCRDDAPVADSIDPERLRSLHVSSELSPVDPAADLDSDDPLPFRLAESEGLTTTSPLIKKALVRLAQAWPERLPFAELGDHPGLPAAMLRLYAGGLVTLHTTPAPFTAQVSERPRASAVARWQAAAGKHEVTTRLHTSVALDAASRHCLALLDGARDHAAIARDMAAFTGLPDETLAGGLRDNLKGLARFAVLEA